MTAGQAILMAVVGGALAIGLLLVDALLHPLRFRCPCCRCEFEAQGDDLVRKKNGPPPGGKRAA